MSIAQESKTGLDYKPCQYGASRIAFRGPARPLDVPYVAVIGGSETYGKFVETPFADLLEAAAGAPVINLGAMHAGLGLFLDEPAVLDVASRDRMTVIQVLGAQNMSNRFYTVHPRRNDRFLKASGRMQTLFPGIDFTEFNFTGHLLTALEEAAPLAFADLVAELKEAWVRRMTTLLERIQGERVLLWMSSRRPEDSRNATTDGDPLLVDREMLEALAPHVAGLVEVVASARTQRFPLKGKRFHPEEAAAAMPGPRFHQEVAEALAPVVRPLRVADRAAGRADIPGFRRSRRTG
ncbi:MAG: DUF6473 family protein [Paracoccaceae bacterium]|nr:DUF6473 family protein [Paracoccaceae bacterium]